MNPNNRNNAGRGASFPNFAGLLRQNPQARAQIAGSSAYPDIRGSVIFYQTSHGVVVAARIMGLPNPGGQCDSPIFAFHIHEGNSCSNSSCRGGVCPQGADPFADARMHYNPYDCPHPYHAGDMSPLFGANGYAFSVFLTDRFTVDEIIGRTVIIHASPDDFMTQPSGNAGAKIACGVIMR